MADDLDDYLNSLPDKVHDELARVIEEQANKLSDAQHNALVALEASEPTGDLAESCTVVRGENDLEFIVQAGGDATTGEVRAGSGKDFDYGEAFEYGTRHQPARPFFWPTYNVMRDDMQDEINEAIGKALE